MGFDLVDESWIPVVGHGIRVGLREALVGAHRIGGLAPDYPPQAPAILRQVLLPVILDAGIVAESNEQWADWFNAGRFSTGQIEAIETYLAEHRGLFELFDQHRPFGQVAGLATGKDSVSSVALLVAPVASGNNVPLMSPYTDADDLELSPAEAACWMLHAQCWDTAGIKPGAVGDPEVAAGKTTGNPVGALGGLGVVIPTGRTLFETLLLNLPVLHAGRDPRDAPQWRRDSARGAAWEQRPAEGLMGLLTWQSRRIRLIPTETERGIVVNRVVLTAGDRLTEVPGWEPHTLWRRGPDVKKGKLDVVRPRRHDSGRAAWRGVDALVALDLPADGEGELTSRLLRQLGEIQADDLIALDVPVNIEVHGYAYGNMSAIIEDNIFDTVPLPVLALTLDNEVRELVLRMANQARRLESAVNRLAADLRRAAGGNPVPWDKGQRPGTRVIHALDAIVRKGLFKLAAPGAADLLARIESGWELLAYRACHEVADELLAGAAPETFGGRTEDTRTFRAANAERSFNAALAEILPRAREVRKTTDE